MRQTVFVVMACAAVTVIAAARDLPLPEVPDSLRDPRQRAEYVIDRYWDAMDWRDTVHVFSFQAMRFPVKPL